MPNTRMWRSAALVAIALLAGCDDASTARNPLAPSAPSRDVVSPSDVYDQVEFLGNPLVSEVTIQKANHDAYNRTQPYNTATFLPQTAQFVTGVAGPPQDLAA